jgi:methyl-accepting chemotaxis protein
MILKSIQAKLTITILVIFGVALGILGGLNYWQARNIILDDISATMSKEAINSAEFISHWIKNNQAEIAGMTAAPVIQRGNKEEIGVFLANVVKDNHRFQIISYAGLDGNYIGSSGSTGNISQGPYFQKVMKGETVVTNPIPLKGSGKLIISVSVPVKTNGKVTGMLSGQISLDDVIKQIAAIKIGQTGYAYVVQEDGLIIMHPDQEKVMKDNVLHDQSSAQSARAANERIARGETGSAIYDYQGVKKMASFAPIPGTSWSLSLSVPLAEVTGVVASFTIISLVTTIVMLIVAGMFIVWYARRIVKPIQALEQSANRIAAGDLSQTQVNIESKDEIGRLGRSFEQMAQNLRELIRKVQSATEQVSASSQELTASSEQSAQAANQIAAAITEVAQSATGQMKSANETTAIVEHMSASMQQIVANANAVAGHTANVTKEAKNGDETAMQAVEQITQLEVTVTKSAQVVAKLGERSKEIGQIVDTISSIAGQTDLLALNAAIEAARAGEQGRGFAVVAEEVRKLAEQSQDAAKKIADLIGEIQKDTDQAVNAMDNGTREVKIGTEVVTNAGEAFRKIAALVENVAQEVKGILASMQQMASESQQIVSSIKRIDALGQKSASESQGVSAAAEEQLAAMEEIASSSQALANLAQNLQTAVNGFKI